MTEKEINELNQTLNTLPAETALAFMVRLFETGIVFSTSFSSEDQVITHLIAYKSWPVNFFTLDTGRLFPETYGVWSRTLEFYGIKINAYYPDANALENFVLEKGPNAFYNSVEERKMCCHIRKVEPLKRALQNKKLWITGLRREHSPERQDLNMVEWDTSNHIVKFHPLLNWSDENVKNFVHQNGIPYNPLHDKGFISIGCAPCTRAIRPGENFRAGRWWWDDTSKKECGLHVK